MKDEAAQRGSQNKPAKKNPREDRLKQALRENLKRRKSQSKGRGELPVSDGAASAPPDDDNRAKKSDPLA